MTYKDGLHAKVAEELNSNDLYYQMMLQWHDLHKGLAVEPEVKSLIESRCRPGFRILDAGSGSGCITNWFANRYPDVQFIGADISSIGVDMARQNARSNAAYEVADLTKLPFNDMTFNFAFSQSVLEHVVGWEEALAELHRVLLPGGEVLIRVGNAGVRNTSSPYRALINYLLLRNRTKVQVPSFKLEAGNWSDHETNFDVQEIPSDVLLQALRRCGFSISYFTTGIHRWRLCSNWKARLVSYLELWPFTHLGATTIVLAEK